MSPDICFTYPLIYLAVLLPVYSYFTLCTNHIPAAMATFSEDDRIRIPKLKEAENYRPRAIYVQATLESRGVWNIVRGTQVAPATPESNSEKLNKDAYLEYSQKHASAKGILILSIDPSILTDKCTTNTTKEIWDYYSTNIRRKNLYYGSPYLSTSLPRKYHNLSRSLHIMRIFQITLDKLQSSGDSIPDDLKLAEYLHGIEDTYPDVAAAHRSAA